MSAAWEQARIAVQKTGEKILHKRLVAGTWGNISTLIAPGGPVAITPSALPYDELTPEDVVIVAWNGDILAGSRPSSELALHLAIYAARPDISAIIHTHSTYACACAVAGKSIPPSLEEVVAAVGGEISVAEYGFPGTEKKRE